jgi:hypothetical protein
MPHFKFCGRYWTIASDELFITGFCALVGRAFWTLLVLTALFIAIKPLQDCADGWQILLYLSLVVCTFSTAVILEGLVISASVDGTPTDTNKRDAAMRKYLSAHILIATIEFGVAIYGVTVVSGHAFLPCYSILKHTSNSADIILLSVVIASQFIDISMQLCCCYIFSSSKIDPSLENPETDIDEATKVGHRCMHVLCNACKHARI